jgi:hypothetical protein
MNSEYSRICIMRLKFNETYRRQKEFNGFKSKLKDKWHLKKIENLHSTENKEQFETSLTLPIAKLENITQIQILFDFWNKFEFCLIVHTNPNYIWLSLKSTIMIHNLWLNNEIWEASKYYIVTFMYTTHTQSKICKLAIW